MRITKKIAKFILITFMFTIFINTTVTANDTNLTFDTLVIGKSYQFKNSNVLYSYGDFTVDHDGYIYIKSTYLKNIFAFSSELKIYSPLGDYLYSICIPHAEYILTTDPYKNHIYAASPAHNTILEFDSKGILINKSQEINKNSLFYQYTIYKDIKPHGVFYDKHTNRNVAIFLKKYNNQEIVYFEKNIEKSSIEKFFISMLILLCIFIFIILLDGIIYKIRNNGKITNAFLFSNIKKAIVKINTKCKESMYPPK